MRGGMCCPDNKVTGYIPACPNTNLCMTNYIPYVETWSVFNYFKHKSSLPACHKFAN